MGLIIAMVLPAVVGSLLIIGSRRINAGAAGFLALAAAAGALVATVAAAASGARIKRSWVADWGIGANFATDQISSPLALLTASITVLVVLHGLRHRPPGGSAGLYYGLLLLVELGALATFWTRDLIVFFIAFEIVLIPMWVLIHRFGDNHDPVARREAAIRFVLYTALGSSIMLTGILALVGQAGTSDMRQVLAAGLTSDTQLWIALLLVIGLAVKVPVFPFHSWLPPAHTIAPTAGSVLLAAVLLKMGTYGLIRLPLALTPDGFARVGPLLATLGVVGILWGGLICLVERDLKRLIAYSSVAHMGFVALALGTGSGLGLQAALIANVAHGVISALLFFVVGALKDRWGSVDLSVVRPALRESWPGLGVALMVGLAGSLGLPGLAGFWGEFLAIASAWNPQGSGAAAPIVWLQDAERIGWFAYSPLDALFEIDGIQIALTAGPPNAALIRGLAVAAALGAVLAAAYSLRVAKLIWMGDEAPRDWAGDVTPVEALVMAVLAIAIIVLGLMPYLIFSGPTPFGGVLR
ncbi:MAG: NADH-quinone oxidoreductase subunit M [Actinobacteria bacterium]|nr:NADH-quinone oxidoreductase subunit M [Actinomycetota bacterium]